MTASDGCRWCGPLVERVFTLTAAACLFSRDAIAAPQFPGTALPFVSQSSPSFDHSNTSLSSFAAGWRFRSLSPFVIDSLLVYTGFDDSPLSPEVVHLELWRVYSPSSASLIASVEVGVGLPQLHAAPLSAPVDIAPLGEYAVMMRANVTRPLPIFWNENVDRTDLYFFGSIHVQGGVFCDTAPASGAWCDSPILDQNIYSLDFRIPSFTDGAINFREHSHTGFRMLQDDIDTDDSSIGTSFPWIRGMQFRVIDDPARAENPNYVVRELATWADDTPGRNCTISVWLRGEILADSELLASETYACGCRTAAACWTTVAVSDFVLLEPGSSYMVTVYKPELGIFPLDTSSPVRRSDAVASSDMAEQLADEAFVWETGIACESGTGPNAQVLQPTDMCTIAFEEPSRHYFVSLGFIEEPPPSPMPTLAPTSTPTTAPPTPVPTPMLTSAPTEMPTAPPTASPTSAPPSPLPTSSPSPSPTLAPVPAPAPNGGSIVPTPSPGPHGSPSTPRTVSSDADEEMFPLVVVVVAAGGGGLVLCLLTIAFFVRRRKLKQIPRTAAHAPRASLPPPRAASAAGGIPFANPPPRLEMSSGGNVNSVLLSKTVTLGGGGLTPTATMGGGRGGNEMSLTGATMRGTYTQPQPYTIAITHGQTAGDMFAQHNASAMPSSSHAPYPTQNGIGPGPGLGSSRELLPPLVQSPPSSSARHSRTPSMYDDAGSVLYAPSVAHSAASAHHRSPSAAYSAHGAPSVAYSAHGGPPTPSMPYSTHGPPSVAGGHHQSPSVAYSTASGHDYHEPAPTSPVQTFEDPLADDFEPAPLSPGGGPVSSMDPFELEADELSRLAPSDGVMQPMPVPTHQPDYDPFDDN